MRLPEQATAAALKDGWLWLVTSATSTTATSCWSHKEGPHPRWREHLCSEVERCSGAPEPRAAVVGRPARQAKSPSPSSSPLPGRIQRAEVIAHCDVLARFKVPRHPAIDTLPGTPRKVKDAPPTPPPVS
jgi:hypothetical protein